MTKRAASIAFNKETGNEVIKTLITLAEEQRNASNEFLTSLIEARGQLAGMQEETLLQLAIQKNNEFKQLDLYLKTLLPLREVHEIEYIKMLLDRLLDYAEKNKLPKNTLFDTLDSIFEKCEEEIYIKINKRFCTAETEVAHMTVLAKSRHTKFATTGTTSTTTTAETNSSSAPAPASSKPLGN